MTDWTDIDTGANPFAMQEKAGRRRFGAGGTWLPGAAPKEIWDSYNAFMRDNGRPEEKRLYCHGQGYDMVERPLVRNDEPMPIAAKMNIVVHPTYIRGSVMAWLCDNYIIGDNGPGARLHAFPEIVTEL